jgi:uncharacterized RDD family membrane protein YckC
LGARIIDGLLLFVPFIIVLFVLSAALPKHYRACTVNGETGLCHVPTAGSLAVLWLVGLAWFAATIAYVVIKVGRDGATVGQKAVGIRVVDESSGEVIGYGRAAGRYFMSIVSGWPCYLGYFWMLWDRQRQTWHDKVVRSVVVRA